MLGGSKSQRGANPTAPAPGQEWYIYDGPKFGRPGNLSSRAAPRAFARRAVLPKWVCVERPELDGQRLTVMF